MQSTVSVNDLASKPPTGFRIAGFQLTRLCRENTPKTTSQTRFLRSSLCADEAYYSEVDAVFDSNEDVWFVVETDSSDMDFGASVLQSVEGGSEDTLLVKMSGSGDFHVTCTLLLLRMRHKSGNKVLKTVRQTRSMKMSGS